MASALWLLVKAALRERSDELFKLVAETIAAKTGLDMERVESFVRSLIGLAAPVIDLIGDRILKMKLAASSENAEPLPAEVADYEDVIVGIGCAE